MRFAMGHFQTKKPRDKARREFRHWRMSPAEHWGALPYKEVSGKIWVRNANHFQGKKMPYMPDFGNSRRGHASSTRWSLSSGIFHLVPILPKSRQNSPEGLVYGNSNATTAFANSRLVVPALWGLTAHIFHRAFITIFTSNAITKDSEQGFY